MFIGAGTVINVGTVLLGSFLGVALGGRLPQRTRDLITQALGLFTLVLGAYAVVDGLSPALTDAVGSSAGMLIVLGALLLGGIVGAGVRLEDRLDGVAGRAQRRLVRAGGQGGRFAEAAVTATLVFCVGPLAILGSLSDGLGQGARQLIVKAVMDGFAATAFAASLGIGVAASVVPLALYQGAWTLVGWAVGSLLSTAQVDALGATGGVILLGLGIRLIGAKRVLVGDLLPALVFAPLLVWLVAALR
jgi:uncharacterized membrane protein YqgA involved in biofilm formation